MLGPGTAWVVENLNEIVDAEFDSLPADIQAKFMHLATLIEDVGLTSLHEPYVKHLQGKLWELRVKAKSGLGRGLYCTITGRRVIVLRYFQKQSDKTPRNEIAVALDRMRTVEE
ncbi:MAG: type II toxin-antitoxin system RelE/ParE family toxin [Deltaproteobacteria bacterium]|jgi:phage-related protein|nr:type II toxin-antitoxin system RelE/ParE family toxin [Deltaproteobacteria bacterium]